MKKDYVAEPHDGRHVLSMVYWSLLAEHHQAVLHLVESDYHASAFALLRCFEEAFLRLFVAMYGTDNEVAALWDDKYNAEFEVLGKRMDEKLGVDTQYRDFFKIHIKTLHSFTHGGTQQLAKFIKIESNNIAAIEPQFSADALQSLVIGATATLFLAALFSTDFWGHTSEHQTVHEMHHEYLKEATKALGIDDANARILNLQ